MARDLGAPIAFLALREGTPVYDRGERRIGVVEHVAADDVAAIFEGVIIHTTPLPGRHLFADVEQIAELRERGVLLSVDRDALHAEGGRARARARDDDDDSAESALQARVRRALDWISGRR